MRELNKCLNGNFLLLYFSLYIHFAGWRNYSILALRIKGDVIPAPESELEYDSRPSFTPDSGTGSFALESMVPAPSQVLTVLCQITTNIAL